MNNVCDDDDDDVLVEFQSFIQRVLQETVLIKLGLLYLLVAILQVHGSDYITENFTRIAVKCTATDTKYII